MTTFLHFADAHVNNLTTGRQKDGLPIRMLDIFSNFDMLVDHAIAEQVDYVIFAGDMYLHTRPANHVRQMVYTRIMRLAQNNIKVILIPGNHDMTKNETGLHALHEFGALNPTNIYLADTAQTIHFPGISFACVPWQYNPIHTLPEGDICIAHCSTDFAVFESGVDVGETVLEKDFIIPSKMFEDYTYTALGHIHKAQAMSNIVYPGSMELLTWGEAKDGSTHGFIHWDNGSWYKIPYKTRKRVTVEIDLTTNYILPDPDPETMYQLTFVSEDPSIPLPNLQIFRNIAFDVTVKDLRRKLATPRMPITPNMTEVELIRNYLENNGVSYDSNMEKLCQEIITGI